MIKWPLLLVCFFSHAHAFSNMHLVANGPVETALGGIRLNIVGPTMQQRPLSCEAAALSGALKFMGIKIEEAEILNHMPFDLTPKGEGIWGDPETGFVGDIDGKSLVTGYGIHWQALSKLALRWSDARYLDFATAMELYDEIKAGRPLLVWISYDEVPQIIQWRTPKGKSIKAVKDEHVVLLYGVEGSRDHPFGYYLMDPDRGMTYLSAPDFFYRWTAFGRPAVLFNSNKR